MDHGVDEWLWRWPLAILCAAGFGLGCGGHSDSPGIPEAISPPEWHASMTQLCWVDYSPTSFVPGAGTSPSLESVERDLRALRDAYFTGLVTYGGDIVSDLESFVDLADSLGFEGVILGVWNPNAENELAVTIAAAKHPIVTAVCVGNEGLWHRYSVTELQTAIALVKEETGKPVATTEEYPDYEHEDVLNIGDWVFPNVHPYWSGVCAPESAVSFTQEAYRDLCDRTSRFVFLKEVGLPTAGASCVAESSQAAYYNELALTNVAFVYFEAFDQSWKLHEPVEPFWGIFRQDRTPKPVARVVCR